MKNVDENRYVTLTVHGQERTFSRQELIDILEEHFPNEAIENVKTVKAPTEGQWFEVNPLGIDLTLFEKKREDKEQESTRKLILEAFEEVIENPEKYGKKFKTMMPKKTWSSKTSKEIMDLACELGDHNADWVEQSLEWAQRIANGESWEDICNELDTAKYYRLVIWKDGYPQLVGGSRRKLNYLPASCVDNYLYDPRNSFYYTVPLVVIYEK